MLVTLKRSAPSRNFQLHIEWKIPKDITGSSQARGNSGVFLALPVLAIDAYELQVLDSYNNKTYVNGQGRRVAHHYKQGGPNRWRIQIVSPASGRATT